MTWIEDLSARLVGSGLNLVAGQSLFAGRRIDDADLPDRCVVLTEYLGTVMEHFGDSSDLEEPRLQVFVRSRPEEWSKGRALAWSIHRNFRSITEETVGSSYLKRVAPIGTPTPFDLDSMLRHSWTVDFRVLLPSDAPIGDPS